MIQSSNHFGESGGPVGLRSVSFRSKATHYSGRLFVPILKDCSRGQPQRDIRGNGCQEGRWIAEDRVSVGTGPGQSTSEISPIAISPRISPTLATLREAAMGSIVLLEEDLRLHISRHQDQMLGAAFGAGISDVGKEQQHFWEEWKTPYPRILSDVQSYPPEDLGRIGCVILCSGCGLVPPDFVQDILYR